MAKIDVVRAWKDPVYRTSLRGVDAAGLPPHPAGLVELSDAALMAAGGLAGPALTTAPGCTEFSFHGFRRCCPK